MDMIINTINEMDSTIAFATGGLIAAVLAGMAFFAFLRYLLTAVGYYKMFGKAGIAGWKAFIPFYSDFNKYQLAWSGKMFFVFLAAGLANSLLVNMDSTAAQLLSIIPGILAIVLMIKQEIKMARVFGKGTGTGLLLLVFPFVTAPVLGFGKAQYQGN